jgi:hypothetical protein
MRATHATSSTAQPRIVVRGAVRPVHVWPEERTSPTSVRRAAEVGDPEQVVALLAEADGCDEATYLVAHGADVASIRALAAHCEAAILHAALRVAGELTPAAVLSALHADLGTAAGTPARSLHLLAS